MPRPKTTGDEGTKKQIRDLLRSNKKMYLSQIARALDRDPSTIFTYINSETGFMKDEVEMIESVVGERGKNLVTYYRLVSR